METIIFSGNANLPLAQKINYYLGKGLGNAKISTFSDGETQVCIDDNVRGKHVFIIQSTNNPANDHIMELMIMIDAVRRSGAQYITAVIPYFGYSRQDRRVGYNRTPIAASLVANLLTAAGVHQVITMDLHAQQIQGFFSCQIDNITAKGLFAEHIDSTFKDKSNILFVSPDVGGVTRTRELAAAICDSCDLAIIDKRRPKANVSEVMNVIGDPQGKICILVDDMVDTAGTLCKAADALKERGALEVYAYCTHAVLSGSALETIKQSQLTKLVCTNTIKHNNLPTDKFIILDTAKCFAETIRRVYTNDSVSQLYSGK